MANIERKRQATPPEINIVRFAQELDIPPTGVTVLGGRPYVNKIGLLHKAHAMGLQSIEIQQVKDAWDSEDMAAAYKAKVTMKDGSYFEDEGWASLKSVKMSTLHNPDYINMTAITRAKNRALGSATGCGYVSAEELETGEEIIPEADIVITSAESKEKAPVVMVGDKPTSLKSLEYVQEEGNGKVGVTKQRFDAYKSQCFEYVDEDTLKKLASNLKMDGKKLSELKTKDLDDLLKASMHFAEMQEKENQVSARLDDNGKDNEESIDPFPIGEEEADDVKQEDPENSEE